MAIKFNAKEVFEIAVKVEENGAAFYRLAADMHPKHAGLLGKLAAMEDEHKVTFAAMGKALSDLGGDVMNDPNEEAFLYLKSIADTHGGEGALGTAQKMSGNETIQDILDIAIQAEKRSILFYVGLEDLVPESLGRKHIDRIIAEEKQHVVTLLSEQNRL